MTNPQYWVLKKINAKGHLTITQLSEMRHPFEDDNDLNASITEMEAQRLLYTRGDHDSRLRLTGIGEEALRQRRREARHDVFAWVSLFLSITSTLLALGAFIPDLGSFLPALAALIP